MMGTDERPELVMEFTNSFVRTNPEIARHFARVTFFSNGRLFRWPRRTSLTQ